jgi:peptidoglycan/LPS O-acetylase OafA/YrhL
MGIYENLRAALNSPVIAGVDVTRALAILLVLSFHWRLLPVSGPMGVMIFFVLSGFLITSMLLREHRKTGTISLRTFYLRRAFRIFPTFYVCWGITGVLYWWLGMTASGGEYAASFFYVEDYFRALHPHLQTSSPMWISWSLSIEEQFYLLLPAMLLLVAKRQRRLIAGITAIILAVWINRAVLIFGFGFTWIYLYNAFDTRVDALMVGSLLAVLVRSRETSAYLLWSLRSRWLVCIPVLLLGAMSTAEFRNFFSSRQALIVYMLEPIVIAFMLLQFIFWGNTVWSFFHNSVIRFIARISYALYLYHIPVFMIVVHFHHGKRSAIPLTFGVSTASYFLIERPFMRLRDRGRRQQSPLTSLADATPASITS